MNPISASNNSIAAITSGVTGLAAGTLVTTPDGDKKIEEIKAGDLVLSGVGQGQTAFHKIAKVMSKPYCGPILRVMTNLGHQIIATPNHICFSYDERDSPQDNPYFLQAFGSYYERTGNIKHYLFDGGKIKHFNKIDDFEEKALTLPNYQVGDKIECYALFMGYKGFKFMLAIDLQVGMGLPTLFQESLSPTFANNQHQVNQAEITNIIEE